MKKLLSLLSIAFVIAVIAPSCSSQDESFEEIILTSNLDTTTDGPVPNNGNGNGNGNGNKPGGD